MQIPSSFLVLSNRPESMSNEKTVFLLEFPVIIS